MLVSPSSAGMAPPRAGFADATFAPVLLAIFYWIRDNGPATVLELPVTAAPL
ncbi:hypothetical protein C8J57DRAFT_1512635 [Mycena rebaudengoi]|nr:hypothetical protein C8J57DRAFT_1512635 [Mycena rebaudengoi]